MIATDPTSTPAAVPPIATSANPAIGVVLERLVRDPARYFPGTAGPLAIAAVTVIPRRLSDVARVTLSAGGAPLPDIYVKVHKKPTSPVERVRYKAGLEFEMLSRLHGRFQALPGFAVARPIAFFPDEIAVVTEAVPGENLHRLTKRLARGWPDGATLDRLRAACRASGTWLRHFQEMTAEPRTAALPAEALREQVTQELETCAGMGLPRARAEHLLRFLDACLAEVRGREYPVTGEHPDFQPDNILVAPGTLTVIDFTSFRPGSAYSDQARFLASLLFLGKHPLYRRRTLDALADSFLEGYEWPRDRRDPALMAYLIRFVVQAVRTASTWPHPAPVRWLVARGAARFLGGWIERVVRAEGRLAT